jgi:DAACS family dicarboxylate/amino acid:cation (Na+ or H+) symporter
MISAMPRHTHILFGLLFGAFAGIGANVAWGGEDPRVEWIVFQLTEPIGELFLRLLLMMVVPLVFSSLVVGVAGIGDIRRVGRIGLKTFVYTLVISAISVAIGIALANTIRPGQRLPPATADALIARYGGEAGERVAAAGAGEAGASPLMQVVRTLVPSNPVAAVGSATPNMLHLMFFAVLIAIGITMVDAAKIAPFVQALEGLFDVSAKIIDLIMRAAPFAVACLLFTTTARFGFDLLVALGWYVATVLGGLSLHMLGVYSVSVAVLSRIAPV